MGVSYRPMDVAVVRTGAERAVLVRRTYSLVFASVLVTMAAVAFSMGQPRILAAVAREQEGINVKLARYLSIAFELDVPH